MLNGHQPNSSAPERTPERGQTRAAYIMPVIIPVPITAQQYSLLLNPEQQNIIDLERSHKNITAVRRQIETSSAAAIGSGCVACCIATPPCGMWHVLAFSFSVSGSASCCLFAKEAFKDEYKPEVQEFDRIAQTMAGVGEQSYQNMGPSQSFSENIRKMRDEQKIFCCFR